MKHDVANLKDAFKKVRTWCRYHDIECVLQAMGLVMLTALVVYQCIK